MKQRGFVRHNIRVVSVLSAKRRFRPAEGIVFSPEFENTRRFKYCRVFCLIDESFKNDLRRQMINNRSMSEYNDPII